MEGIRLGAQLDVIWIKVGFASYLQHKAWGLLLGDRQAKPDFALF